MATIELTTPGDSIQVMTYPPHNIIWLAPHCAERPSDYEWKMNAAHARELAARLIAAADSVEVSKTN